MKTKPVTKYKLPSYPCREEILCNPLLLKALPERWKVSVAAGVALSSLMLITLTSCGDRFQGERPRADVSSTGNPSLPAENPSPPPEVAPIFIHGDGRGGFGCVSVAPPAFLSEEEAFQVIREEAEKLGVKLEKGGPAIDNIQVPVTNLYPTGETNENKLSTTSGRIELDGYDPARKIGFEFISTDDVKGWHRQGDIYSSVESYDFMGAAQTLHNGLQEKNPDTTLGVFYDPASMLPQEELFTEKTSMEEKGKKVRQMAEEELRYQVRDFLDWLKAQGVI